MGWLPTSLLSRPSEVALDLGKQLASGALFHHSWVSLRRLFIGFAVGSVLAVFFGALVGLSRRAERILAPTFSILAPVPVSAWIPLIIILFGIEELSKVSVIAVGTFFLVFFGTVEGIRSVDNRLVEVALMYGKTRWQLLIYILIPSACGSIIRGMRSALGLGWILLVVAEVIASSDGLGWLMWDARNFSRPADLVVGMIAVGALGALTDFLLAHLQKRLMFWNRTFVGQ